MFSFKTFLWKEPGRLDLQSCKVQTTTIIFFLFGRKSLPNLVLPQIVDCNNNIFHRKNPVWPSHMQNSCYILQLILYYKIKTVWNHIFTLCLFFSYNNATGEFTVPSGGDGLYFFYINFFVDDTKITDFVVGLNGVTDLCYARADMNSDDVADNGTPTCGAVATVSAGNRWFTRIETNKWNNGLCSFLFPVCPSSGDVLNVVYLGEIDDFPVNSDTLPYNTFTGFRIAPQ